MFKPGDKVRTKYYRPISGRRTGMLPARAGNAVVLDPNDPFGTGNPLDSVQVTGPEVLARFHDAAPDQWWLVYEDDTLMGWDEPIPDQPSLQKVIQSIRDDPLSRRRDALLAYVFGFRTP